MKVITMRPASSPIRSAGGGADRSGQPSDRYLIMLLDPAAELYFAYFENGVGYVWTPLLDRARRFDQATAGSLLTEFLNAGYPCVVLEHKVRKRT